MLELIDKEAAYIALKREAEAHMLPESHEAYIRAARIIDQMKPIEAEPVRHGKLLEGKTFNDQHCSVCGQMFRDDICFILPSDENGFPMPKRCPECGCYWDGGADNG